MGPFEKDGSGLAVKHTWPSEVDFIRTVIVLCLALPKSRDNSQASTFGPETHNYKRERDLSEDGGKGGWVIDQRRAARPSSRSSQHGMENRLVVSTD